MTKKQILSSAKSIFSVSHIIVTVITLVIFGLGYLFTTHLTFFNPVKRAIDNFHFSDMYYQMLNDTGQKKHNDIITIIDATQLYDRTRIGEMFEEVAECKPAVVGIDCIYQGFRGDTIGTHNLVEATLALDAPVFAIKLKGYDENKQQYSTVVKSVMFIPELDGILKGGFTNVSYDSSRSTIRNFVTDLIVNGDTLHSLSYMIASAFSNDVVNAHTLEPQLIDYSPTEFNVVPYDSIRQHKDLIRDHVALIGAMDDDADKHFSPLGLCPGTEIQAYMTQTLLEHSQKYNVNGWIVFIISFFIIWITEVVESAINRHAAKSKNILIQYITGTALFNNIFNLIWVGILVYFNFILFSYFDIYFNPTVMLVGIALLVEARLSYESAVKILKVRRLKQRKSKKKKIMKINLTQ